MSKAMLAADAERTAGSRQVLRQVTLCWAELAAAIDGTRAGRGSTASNDARRLTETLCFLGLCRRQGLIGADGASLSGLESEAAWSAFGETYGDDLLGPHTVGAAVQGVWRALSVALSASRSRPELLGRIHECLLDRQLEAKAGGSVRIVSARPERKARGIFYTPPAIAAYIVQRALDGRGLRTDDSPFEMMLLDPACGSGHFLVAAARWLAGAARRAGISGIEREIAGQLHGADIDAEAVLIARRVVWLELLSSAGRPAPALGRELAQRLSQNIVPADILTESGRATTPEGQSTATSSIEPPGPAPWRQASFDLLLGNPPFHRELGHRCVLSRLARTDLGRRVSAPRMDLSYYFVHRGLELLKPGGRLAYVMPAYWTTSRGASNLRLVLRDAAHIDEITLLEGKRFFTSVSGRHMVLIVTNRPSNAPTLITGNRHPRMSFEKTPSQLFHGSQIDLEPPADRLLEKLALWPCLERLGKVRQGIVENPATITAKMIDRLDAHWRLGEGVFSLAPDEVTRLAIGPAEQNVLRPYYDLCDLGRYWIAPRASRTLIYSTAETWDRLEECPRLAAHLERFRPILDARRETRLGRRPWWHLHWPRAPDLWKRAKIVALQMARRPAVAPVTTPAYVSFSVNVFAPSSGTTEHLYYLAAILNSRLMWKWYRHRAKRRGVGLEINGHVLAATPVRRIDLADAAQRRRHDRLVELVGERMSSDSRAATALESAIDAAVYELYGLSDAEIATVEAATAE